MANRPDRRDRHNHVASDCVRHGRSVVGSREFAIREEAPSDDAHGGVVAANRAVEKLLEQVINWLSAIMNEQLQRRG